MRRLFFFSSLSALLNLGFHYDFYESFEVKVCIFIRICFVFFLVLQKVTEVKLSRLVSAALHVMNAGDPTC